MAKLIVDQDMVDAFAYACGKAGDKASLIRIPKGKKVGDILHIIEPDQAFLIGQVLGEWARIKGEGEEFYTDEQIVPPDIKGLKQIEPR